MLQNLLDKVKAELLPLKPERKEGWKNQDEQ